MNMRNKIELRYHLVDFDDNILHMDTKIIMEKLENDTWKEIQVSTTDFATLRKDPNYRVDITKAFSNFRDIKGKNNFLEDVKKALGKKNYAPSYEAFKKCLVNGEILGVVTARGNEPHSIKEAFRYIIDNELDVFEKAEMFDNLNKFHKLFNTTIKKDLISDYLDNCDFIGVSSDYFKNLVIDNNLSIESEFNPNNTEVSKKIAVKYIVDKLHNYNIDDSIIKIGFSDDDIHNVNSIHSLFRDELKIKNPNTKFYIFDTSPNQDGSKNYNKVRI